MVIYSLTKYYNKINESKESDVRNKALTFAIHTNDVFAHFEGNCGYSFTIVRNYVAC